MHLGEDRRADEVGGIYLQLGFKVGVEMCKHNPLSSIKRLLEGVEGLEGRTTFEQGKYLVSIIAGQRYQRFC